MPDTRLTDSSAVAFILGRAIAERHLKRSPAETERDQVGDDDKRRANELGLLTAVMGARAMTLVLVDTVARREADDRRRRLEASGGSGGAIPSPP